MVESLLGEILRIRVKLKILSVTGTYTYFHISPGQSKSFRKISQVKKYNAPSALKTPSPSNDLNWEYNIGPKDVIYHRVFRHVVHLPLSKASNWVARIALTKGQHVNNGY